ncbi:MAG: hypothetical protein ACRDC6_32030 [Shewanella sp.]
MKEYMKMDDVFDLRLMDACKLSIKPSCVWSAWDDGVTPHEYAAHAINSHDALVEMNKELLAALEAVANCGRGSSGRIILDYFDEESLVNAITKAKGGAS